MNKNIDKIVQEKYGNDMRRFLIDLYVKKKMNLGEIAELFGVTERSIRRYFIKYMIPLDFSIKKRGGDM